MSDLPIGCIHVGYSLSESGNFITTVSVDGDLSLATQLGMLEIAKDSALIGMADDD